MFSLSRIFQDLFANRNIQSFTTAVQTALEPVHERNVTEGVEFIDDFVRLDDLPGIEINHQLYARR
ncbi:hypothetical protein [uncultured Chitinophaga sp.]|uniref:hypothetical protein n=1 Tax=uncultured Chitinophaga sp. TaxID=339340 RepID=UPI002614A3CC|nr:hypothetical protein [uncultured Chitinophaga sp.]